MSGKPSGSGNPIFRLMAEVRRIEHKLAGRASNHPVRDALAIVRGRLELAIDHGEPIDVERAKKSVREIASCVGEGRNLLSAREVMARFGIVHASELCKFVKNYNVPRIRLNSRVYKYDPVELDKWLARREYLGRARIAIRPRAGVFIGKAQVDD